MISTSEIEDRLDAEEVELRILFDTALAIRRERGKYGVNSWKELGVRGAFVNSYQKLLRLRHMLWDREPDDGDVPRVIDSILDAIVYLGHLGILVDEEHRRAQNDTR
jgi:hypothetical protein